MKKTLALILLACLLLGAMPALAEPEPITLPIVDEPITLHIVATMSPNHVDWNLMASWQELMRRTGINIEFEMIPSSSLAEKRNLKLASNDLPDAFISGGFTSTDLVSYGSDGVIVPLQDYIDQYMPNLKAILDDPGYAVVRPGITFPDGNIYALPHIYEAEYYSMVAQNHFFINQDWLTNLGLDMPTTTDEFYAVLKAFIDEDADGDGDPDNEFALGSKASVIQQLIISLAGSWGVQNRGISHDYVDTDPETGALRFFKTSDAFKGLLEYMHAMYLDGIIEQEAFSMEYSQVVAKATTGQYGVVNCLSPSGDFSLGDYNYVGMPVLIGPNGDQLFSNVASGVARNGGFVLTSVNPYPVETMKMIDYYFYSPEGLILFYLGQEGRDWEYDEDGLPQYMEHITNSAEGLTRDQEVGKFTSWSGNLISSIGERVTSRSVRSLPDAMESATAIHDKFVEAWPPFNYTLQEAEALMALSDLTTYVDSMVQKFIKGDESFDNWDTYVNQVERMGLDEYLSIQDAACERFLSFVEE